MEEVSGKRLHPTSSDTTKIKKMFIIFCKNQFNPEIY